MPLSPEKAREIVERYRELKKRNPKAKDKEIARLLGISPHKLATAKWLHKRNSSPPGSEAQKSPPAEGGYISLPPPGKEPENRPNSTVCIRPPRGTRQVIPQRGVRAPAPPTMRRVPLEGPTLAVADAHLNDVDCLYRSFSSALDVALAQLAELRPPQVNLLIAGDWVAGRGIFRGQEFRLLLGDVNWQALVGAEVLWEVVERIRDACGAQVKTYYVKGNHDVDKSSGFEFGLWVVKLAQQWGLDCEYFPLDVVVELAPGVNALVLHGFGYSMYRPQSPAFINAIMRRVMDLNLGRSPEEQISRVIHGHAHWLDVDFHLSGWGIAIDSLGGWQRNTRLSLGRTSRPTGFILYVPEGEKLYLVPIEPDPQILDQETHNPRLVARNILTVGQWLDRALERLGYEL